MSGSVNKATILGNVGSDPEIRSMQNGDWVSSFSLATSETWKDKSGERQEKTQWHKVVVFNQNIVGVVEKYVKKGSKLYVEGQIETRKWTDKEGKDNYTTEIVIKPFKGELTLLDSKSSGDKPVMDQSDVSRDEEFKDEIPF